MSTERQPVVVGVDGSTGERVALDWAVAEARALDVPLRLVNAYGDEYTASAIEVYGRVPMPELRYVRELAAKLLGEAVARARELAPGLDVQTHAVDDSAVAALLDKSARAARVVLGSRGMGTLGSAVLGSVGAGVAARAKCPVVVVRGPAGLAEEGAAVVVGVDADAGSQEPLAFAFDYASRHRLPLRAVLCWRRDTLAEMSWRPEPPAPAVADEWLSEALAGWRERYPDVSVDPGVVRDHPAAGLVAAAAAQQLLVVGTRGRHAFTGTLLGSVSQGVLHHATCPVAVIPVSSAAEAGD